MDFISDRTSEVLLKTHKELALRGYSENTITAYLGQIQRFQIFSNKDLVDSTNEDVRDFLYYLLKEKGKSHGYVNQTLSALKFLLTKILHVKEGVNQLPRPKKEHKLPDVLSQNEVLQILNPVRNLKHRTLLVLTYSAGLRVSEVVNLKISDIDYTRMLIHVRQGKGKKDRYTVLSTGAIGVLRDYMTSYHVIDWMFPGENPNNHITERTVQRVFENARDKAGIRKNVSVHSLRHSFATHLLESGTDLRYIQELLGHLNSKTTEIYTHVTEKDIQRIRSPFDWISLNGNNQGK
ncbi:site-specific recombinase XerD [Desulfosporosinus orientis DSM 765]|uniref:Site-specific recombinase XerD n=1 Tax=Desulfosporosinus orientis (strain ATCC 19365 / DSM 765 / NCIMB 8382 / VKM B-1628 / Singapore I) TaxID=768706 RepID=G7W8V2_DESOD|nr:site-specific tyrosine recombinase/integron integrase [Desulfosporosinus orientis]AET67812.1 site-specific recombinase XerD [Desulfosporosinus orientis DSM 765]